MKWLLGICLLLVLAGSLWAAGPRVRRSCLIGWDAVTTNQGGGAIDDLTGYRVYTSTTPGITPDGSSYALQVNSSTIQATCRQLGLTVHNQQYYVKVTAIDDEIPANESTGSTELALVVTMGSALFR